MIYPRDELDICTLCAIGMAMCARGGMTELTQQERSELRRSVENRKSEYGRLVADAERLAEVEAALREAQDEEFFEDGVSADLRSDGITTIADAYLDGRKQVLDGLQRILAGGEKDE